MTVQKDGREKYLECDSCTETSMPDSDFSSMIAAAKAAGWVAKPDGTGNWSHTCPGCSQESRLDKARAKFS